MATPTLDIQASPGFWQWLAEQDIGFALTTYQSNRLFFIGRKEESGRLALHERRFDKPMGLFWQADVLTLACRYQIWQLANRLPPGQTHEGGDRLYVPRQSWITGDINVHDVAIDRHGRVLFVNTDFSCLATLDPDYSFVPLWKPPFIRKLAAEDRCHLNGLALRDGEATYLTACSATDEAAGWRNHRGNGGIVLHLPSDSIVASGLSMPHSPRWYRDRLWLLNSGRGELGYLDGEHFVPIAYCPGFGRGLAFSGGYAVVGLSKLRSTSFGGLALEQRLAADGQAAQCGLAIVDLGTGAIVHWLSFGNRVEELFDVAVIPGARQPRALGLQEDAIERLVTFPGADGLVITKPTVKHSGQGTPAPVAGLPEPVSGDAEHDPAAYQVSPASEPTGAGRIVYQRVYHLNPENLLPYDAMTWPRLSQRWATRPARGELLGISAASAGEMIGFAIAERFPIPDGDKNADVISLYVLPAWRGRGIATRLLAHLNDVVGLPLADPRLPYPDSAAPTSATANPKPSTY